MRLFALVIAYMCLAVYATEQGLGYLAKEFYDYGVITDVLVVEHSRRPTKEWYPKAIHVPIRDIAHSAEVERFCSSMDVMLFFETPFDWGLMELCKQHKVRTVLMPMFECMPKSHAQPDAYINPSLLDQQYYPSGTFIPVPVSVPWKQRTRANVFVHNAGHGGLRGRNGTKELLEALQYVQSPLKLIIRSQEQITQTFKVGKHMTVEMQGSVPYDKLWTEGDVFVFPEKFNGLSLPLQEAFASGMLVMCGDRFPMNEWLPVAPLIPVEGYRKAYVSTRCLEFDEAIIAPKDIAMWMDRWYGQNIAEFSSESRKWAENNSWIHLKKHYLEALKP